MSPFGKPTPYHALTPAAKEGRESIRRYAHKRKLEREGALLVTDHGSPHVEPYVVAEWRVTKKGKKKATGRMIPGPRPAAATALAKKAELAGWKVNVFESHERVRTVVEGIRGDVAFRATWLRGRAESGTWHERDWRYAMIEDRRPVGVSKLTRVALAGKRPAGVGTTRLAIVAGPWGIAVGVSEISKRVSAP